MRNACDSDSRCGLACDASARDAKSLAMRVERCEPLRYSVSCSSRTHIESPPMKGSTLLRSGFLCTPLSYPTLPSTLLGIWRTAKHPYGLCHPFSLVANCTLRVCGMKGSTLQVSGPVSRNTARLSQRYPPTARYGVLGVSTWPIGCDTPFPFSQRFPLGEHANWRCDTPPQKGCLSDTHAIPFENKANGCCNSDLVAPSSGPFFHPQPPSLPILLPEPGSERKVLTKET